MTTVMTARELRKLTFDNNFDTIVINGKPKSEYDARRYLFNLDDQETQFESIVDGGVLFLYNQKAFDA